MTAWLRTLGEGAGSGDAALVIIFWTVLVLTGLSGLLAIAATLLRVAHLYQEARCARLWASWTPVLLDVLAGDAEPEALEQRVGPRDRAAFVRFLLQYVFTIKGQEVRQLERLAMPHLPVMERFLRRRDPHERVQGIQALGLLGHDKHAAAVLDALDDRSDLVAMTAAQILSRRGDPVHAAAVVDRLERFRRWGLSHVTSMLTGFGPGAAPLLLWVYADASRELFARIVAGEALRWLNRLEAADVAAEILTSGADPELVAVSLRLLRRLGQASHADVVRAFCDSPEAIVRIHAVSALAALSGRTEADALRAAFYDPSHWVAMRAARGLRESGHVAVLEEMAASDHMRAPLARQILTEEG